LRYHPGQDPNAARPPEAMTLPSRVSLLVLLALAAPVLGSAGLLLFWSWPGRPEPFRGADGRLLPGSVSEKLRVRINGVEQGMFLKGRDTARPVLLYLHGGMPDYFLSQLHPAGLEELFTVCWWEQRGSGISYDPGAPPGSVTLEQLVSDTLEVANYLRRRFGQERIYLMGHSGGTFLGMLAIARAPQLFHAYVGVAQMSDQFKSEQLAYAHLLAEYRRRGDAAMVRRLEAAPVTPAGIPDAYYDVRDVAMHELGVGTMRGMRSVATGIFLASLRSREYTPGEKLRTWRGKAATGVSSVWKEMVATDLAKRVPEVEVPVYFFAGAYDQTCSSTLAAGYFAGLKAPLKGLYLFKESAHSPVFEEPERARRILREDVLAGTNGLADER
jgi:pimeloyl-ACP methyl ester carboxylesterase